MLKKNKWKLIISSVAILLPGLIGLLFWDKLPENIIMHWGIDGKADGAMGARTAIFMIPLLLLAVHWICMLITTKDKNNDGQNPKFFGIIFWIIPVLSFVVNGIMYMAAVGKALEMSAFLFVFLGAVFAFIGNYLPKCRKNFTMGIRTKWTLADEETWTATHRIGGKVSVICGIAIMLLAFAPIYLAFALMAAIIIAQVVILSAYSYRYYKKRASEGKVPEKPKSPYKEWSASGKIAFAVAMAALAVFLAVIMFTGNVSVECKDTSFEVKATFHEDIEVKYSDIDSIEYIEDYEGAIRTIGFSSARLALGVFENQRFGTHTRYTYAGEKCAVVIRSGEKVLVIGGKDSAETKAIYDSISAKISE